MKAFTSKDLWDVVDLFFKSNNLALPQIASYDDFLNVSLTQIAADAPPIIVDVEPKSRKEYKFTRVTLRVLKIYPAEQFAKNKPNDCRLQNSTYALNFNARVQITTQNFGDEEVLKERTFNMECPFCPIPMLLNSAHCYTNQFPSKHIRQQRVRNDECPFDEGGYFIVNGSEKTLIASEVNRSNRITVLQGDAKNPKELISAKVVSSVPERALYCKIDVKLEYVNDGAQKQPMLMCYMPGFDTPINVFILMMVLFPGDSFTDQQLLQIISPDNDPEIINVAKLSYQFCINQGINSPARALQLISQQFKPVLQEAISDQTITELMKTKNHFATRFLPHIGTDQAYNYQKCAFIGYMSNLCIQCHLNKRGFDDRDHWGSKRLQLAGSLLHDLFRRCFGDFCGSVAKEIQRKKISFQDDNQEQIFRNQFKITAVNLISKQLCSSLATGNWRTGRVGQNAGKKTGASQNLVRLSYAAAISQIRRTTSGIEESSKAIGPRILHGTQFGYLCPAETPEGAKVGLVKNFSLQCRISVGCKENDTKIKQILKNFQYEGEICLKNLSQSLQGVKVFFNGQWFGCVKLEHAKLLTRHLKECRNGGRISFETSISYNEEAKELVVASDSGRVLRPLFALTNEINKDKLLENSKLNICRDDIEQAMKKQDGWEYLIKNERRLIEYLDPYEEEQSLICTDLMTFNKNQEIIQQIRSGNYSLIPPTYTHLEIHPCLILSAISALIPFPDHNQAPRNLFQASMGKQAVGIYALNFEKRFDTQGINIIHYPQKPLTQTRTMKYVKFTDLPAGENLVVAIAIYTGFNQEDSLIMSHASVDRGLMRCWYILSHEATCEIESRSDLSKRDLVQKICRPVDNVIHPLDRNCEKYLQADGMGKIGQSIRQGSIVIGKKEPKRDSYDRIGAEGNLYEDCSTIIKNDEIGYIDNIVLAREKRDNYSDDSGSLSYSAKVKVRSNRPPQIGDKFSSRHGQKGTVGMLYRQEDLPFTYNGVTPDIIVNPHAIPSRMTIGQLLECVGSKVGAMLGQIVDGTPFEPPVEGDSHEDYLTSKLFKCGFQKHGYEATFCGFTGKILNYRVFIGPTFYQRLKHMVLDKVSARATGTVTTLTHQPLEGRQRYGGMRIGEMERDTFIAHGAAAVLRDRLMFSSDGTDFLLCKTCGMIAWHADQKKISTLSQPKCYVCDDKAEFCLVTMPYVCKLLVQEVQAMGVQMKFEVQTE
ncbi:DNA-directed_RNA polymerase subunit beta [Hexamita inflata]|uniref:DNA-directed RNA polymerase subunit beta n=1 Tax=Hexamita inflata TaxID=28002 RepID=A0AA86NNU7_9EUKA|nr:DNA-directed RNA polymerase subunit beta [Hexamita inflata]